MAGRIRVKEFATKSESTYAVTETGSFVAHRLVNDTLTPDLRPHGETLKDDSTVTSMHQHNETVLGSQYGGTIQGTIYGEGLHDPLTGGGGGATSISNTAILKAAFGASVAAAGSSVVSGIDTTLNSVEVGAGHGVRFVPNTFVGFITNSGPGGAAQLEAAIVRKVVDDVVHLMWDLASVPAGASIVYNSVSYSLDPDGVGTDGVSQFLQIIGENAQDQWLARGCVPTFEIEAELRGLLKYNVNWRVNNATRTTGLTIGAAGAPTGGHPLAIKHRIVYFGDAPDTDVAATRNVLQVEDVKVTPGLQLADEGGGGTNTLYRLQQMPANPMANITFRAARSASVFASLYSDYGSQKKKYVMVQWGTQPASGGRGGIVCFAIPRAQYDAHVKQGKANGFDTAEIAMGEAQAALCFTGGTATRNASTIIMGNL